jgi:hypothetical protein
LRAPQSSGTFVKNGPVDFSFVVSFMRYSLYQKNPPQLKGENIMLGAEMSFQLQGIKF